MKQPIKCVVIDDDEMSRRIVESLINRVEGWELVTSFASAVEGREFLKNENIDVLFLDVEMPEITGIEFLKLLQNHPEVVIISSKEKYAIDAFEFEVTDYLLKPIDLDRFLRTVSRIEKRLMLDSENYVKSESVFIKTNNQLLGLKLDAIHYVEAYGDYVNIVTEKEKFIVHSTMKGIDNRLPKAQFLRVHRSFIVRIDKINAIDETLIVMGKKLIPIGESYRSELMKKLSFL